jgi:polar amino acid transport system substrate-binding protein
MSKRAIGLIAAALVALTSGNALADGSKPASVDPAISALIPQAIKDAGKIVNYVNIPNPPMEYEDDTGTLTGFDIELAAALSEVLGIPIENQTTPDFAQLIPSILSGRANIVLSGLTDRAERREKVSFVNYFKSGNQFMIMADAADKFKSVADLCGQTVVAATGTSYPEAVAELSQAECTSKGKPAINTIGGTSTPDQILQMTTGRAVAIMMSTEILGYEVQRSGGKFAPLSAPLDSNYYGIIFPKDQPEFGQAIQKALQTLIDNGTYGELLKKWGLTEGAVTKATINSEGL